MPTNKHAEDSVKPAIRSNVPMTMKAAFVTEFGKPLTIGELPVPQPGTNRKLRRESSATTIIEKRKHNDHNY